jgi:hypothetical protein
LPHDFISFYHVTIIILSYTLFSIHRIAKGEKRKSKPNE